MIFYGASILVAYTWAEKGYHSVCCQLGWRIPHRLLPGVNSIWMGTHVHIHIYTHTHRRKRGSRTPAGSATLSQMALEPHIWHTEVLCHTVILSNAAYMFHWELSLRVCEYKKRPFKKAWVWVSDLTATTVKHVITNRSKEAIETRRVDTFQLSFPVVVWSSK